MRLGVLLLVAGCGGAPSPASPAAPLRPPVAAPGSPVVPDAPTCGGDELVVTFYDVGQALAVLVTLPGGDRILVDAGESPRRPGCGAPCRGWSDHLVEGLRRDLAGEAIDLVWITHQHSDHHGGLPSLVEAGIEVERYVDNGTRDDARGVQMAREAAATTGAELAVVDPAHRRVPLDPGPSVDVEAMVPPAWPADCERHPNDCSIGLLVTYCASSILFTGDAERSAEEAWPLRDIDLLQVAHHGSATSTSEAFLATARPEYAVVSSGAAGEGTNRTYCHPRMGTVERLTAATGGPGTRGSRVFDDRLRSCRKGTPEDWRSVAVSDRLWLTATDGDVSLVTRGDGRFERIR